MSDQPSAGTTYPRSTIAKLLMISDSSVNRLAHQGVLVSAGRARFDLVQSVQGYIKYLRDRLPGGDSEVDVNGLRARMITARTRVAEAEADLMDGKLLRRDEVEEAWRRVLVNFRTRILALPSRTAPLVHATPTVAETSAILTTAVHEVLTELARTPVYATEPARAAAARRDAANGAGDPATAAETDDLGMG